MGCREGVTVVRLYPKSSQRAKRSSLHLVRGGFSMSAVKDSHNRPAYIAALAALVEKFWKEKGRGEKLLMSFHGLPKRDAKPYETQCDSTGTLLAEKLGLKDGEWQVTFPSRFGLSP